MTALVPNIRLQFHTYSMWLGIVIGTLDAALALVQQLGDLHFLSIQAVLGINAFLGFMIVPAKLILQSIPATTDEKINAVAIAAAAPVVPGHDDIRVHINGEEVVHTLP
jgi:hypothetical protein